MTVNRRNLLRLTTVAVGSGLTAAAAAGPAGSAQAAGPSRTLRFTGKRSAANLPELLVPGTPYFVHYDLLDEQGQPAGTESAHCTPVTVDANGAVVLASLALRLTGGTITAATAYERPLPAVTETLLAARRWSHTFAVTGGTGEFNGATGELTIDHLTREDDVLTVTLT
ncbi:hypothetical protein ACIRBX_35080 [Kitasatospora sp. NPDC096147]|uniref:hypothetical protein n=1 Tax=Kitasatospora sp. NPDC096147 TaxID=3364093 RepID=UPI00380812F2